MAASLISTCTCSLNNMSLVELTDDSCVVLLYVELHTVSINNICHLYCYKYKFTKQSTKNYLLCL